MKKVTINGMSDDDNYALENEEIIQRCVNCGKRRTMVVPYPFEGFDGFSEHQWDCGCNLMAWPDGR